jgi:predicted Zn-dependent protease
MFSRVEQHFDELLRGLPGASACSLRALRRQQESWTVRNGVLEPIVHLADQGAMLTVYHKGGHGYAATSDLSLEGLRRAASLALAWAEHTAPRSVVDYAVLELSEARLSRALPLTRGWAELGPRQRLELVMQAHQAISGTDPIVESRAGITWQSEHTLFLTSRGGRIEQRYELLAPELSVVASRAGVTQTRSLGMLDRLRQGGLELLEDVSWLERARLLKEEVLELLDAPNCPTGELGVVLMPDQLMLQIHESIGHPLELDRILGDERNYAGTSFVTLDMFGTYQYGSELLNVVFEPDVPTEAASYGADDEGTLAEKQYLIERGKLVRPLGGAVSQARAGLPGTANSRASSWNRPPIDRMANLNIEPGTESLDALIAAVEDGVLMKTNCSWSIDDSRNKFQFGCEWGRRIKDGELREVVRNPNYRGISATFWRSLAGVGDASTREVLGTPYCGKGEPNQAVWVGHRAPACRFTKVDVFGGEA